MPNGPGPQPQIEGPPPIYYLDIDYLAGLTGVPLDEPEDMVADWMHIHQSLEPDTPARVEADAALERRLVDIYGLGDSEGGLRERDHARVLRRMRLLGCLAIEGADPVDRARAKEIGYDFFHLVTKDARDRVRHRETEAARKRAHEMATHDALTGLKNRRGLYEALDEMMVAAQAGEYGELALLYIDLDKFKEVNDTPELGHNRGDEILRGVARVLINNTRQPSRSGGNADVIARLRHHDEAEDMGLEAESIRMGGDEFVLLIPLASRGDLPEIARRLTAKLDAYMARATGGLIHGIGASVGYVVWDRDMNPDELVGLGDKHMYGIKRARKLANGQTNGT